MTTNCVLTRIGVSAAYPDIICGRKRSDKSAAVLARSDGSGGNITRAAGDRAYADCGCAGTVVLDCVKGVLGVISKHARAEKLLIAAGVGRSLDNPIPLVGDRGHPRADTRELVSARVGNDRDGLDDGLGDRA